MGRALGLLDGRVLVIGGLADGLAVTRGAEIYDPATSTSRPTRTMSALPGVAAVLADGRVLVLHAERPAEILDPRSGRWTATSRPPGRATWAQAIGLADGDVLLLNAEQRTAQIFDPTRGSWTAASPPETGYGPAVLFADGTVLLLGRVSSARYGPATGAWTAVARPPLPRDYALKSRLGVEVDLAAPLLDGRLLATEGGSAAVFDPASR
jgi:hypothetical protein